MAASLNDRTLAVRTVRWLLGVQCLLSGLNWWVKILPFPNMAEPVTGPVKHEILRTMVESGWMFTATKMIEVLVGLALLFNVHAVLILVIAFPVMLMTFLLDCPAFFENIPPFLSGRLGFATLWHSFLDLLFFGFGVFVMQAYLMAEYFDDYRSLFVAKPGGTPARWSAVFEAPWLKTMLRWLSYTVGALSTLWIVGMVLRVIPWSSLAILAPPR